MPPEEFLIATLFSRPKYLTLRLLTLILVGWVLVALVREKPVVKTLNGWGADISAMSLSVFDIPKGLLQSAIDYSESRGQMRSRIQELEDRNLILSARAQRMEALAAENMRYRAMLNSPVGDDLTMTVARIIAVSPDPNRHLLTIDRGARDGVSEGAPILNADGVMGQLIQIGSSASRALLVTDSQHGLPVLNNRTGQRGIAEGVGQFNQLLVRNLASTSEVNAGDLWVTSGLGGRFPAGYPVGITVGTTTSADAAYLTASLEPLAKLDVESHVLILTGAESE